MQKAFWEILKLVVVFRYEHLNNPKAGMAVIGSPQQYFPAQLIYNPVDAGDVIYFNELVPDTIPARPRLIFKIVLVDGKPILKNSLGDFEFPNLDVVAGYVAAKVVSFLQQCGV
jgi:hypothetical protein